MDELDGMNGMDVIDGLGVRECIDEVCGVDGMDGMVGRGTTFTPSNNHRVIAVCTHRILAVPHAGHNFDENP